MACVMPTLLNRYGHQALSTHAAILAAIGLYFRLLAGRRLWGAAVALMASCVLIHPYIFALVAAVLAAVPLTLLLRRQPGRWRSAAGLLAGCAVSGGMAFAFGYGGSRPAAGFGFYSMNLLAPLLPSRSSLFPDLAVDATGGQAMEGYQYLGAGLLLLLAAAALPAWRDPGWARRHGGLLLVLAVLGAFALSNRAYAGSLLLYQWGHVPALLEQFRATSRFFWPVAYAGLVGGVAMVARALPRPAAAGVLGLAMLLQVADTGRLRAFVHHQAAGGHAWVLDRAALEPAFAAHRSLTLWPSFGCGAAADQPAAMQVLLIASETLMRTNTMATARDRADAVCDPAGTLGAPLQPGELRVLLHGGDAWRVPGAAAACFGAGALALCSANRASLAGFAPLLLPRLPPGESVGPRNPLFREVAGPGWSDFEVGGVWSDGPAASLLFRRPDAAAVLRLAVTAIAPEPGQAQHVALFVDGQPAGSWRLVDFAPAELTAPVPASGSATVRVELRIAHPVRPIDRGLAPDSRSLGVLLRSIELTGGSG